MFEERNSETPSLEGFTRFVKSQPRKKNYNWDHSDLCACARYAESIGVEDWFREELFGNRVWKKLDTIAQGSGSRRDWNYGQLRKRLKEYA